MGKKKTIDLETLPSDAKKQEAGDGSSTSSNLHEDKDKKDELPEFPEVGFFQLYRYATTSDRIWLTIGILSTMGTGSMQAINMLVFGNLTNYMIIFMADHNEEQFKEDMFWFAIENSLIGVTMLILTYVQTTIFNYCGIRQGFAIRTLYFEKVLNQDISWYDLHQSGDFASRMGDDLIKLEEGIGEKVSMFCHFMFSFLACLIMALVKGWELALICLTALPITMVAMGTVAFLTSKLAKSELDAYGVAGIIAEEVFSTIRTVLAFGGEQKELNRYKINLVFAKDNNIRRSLMSGIGFGILWFCIWGSYALAFWYGVGLVIDDPTHYDPGTMVTVFFSVMTGSMNFGMSSPYIEVFGIARGAASKIFGIIDHEPTINQSKHNGIKKDKINGNITFKNVKFNYPSRPDVPVLTGLNLSIKSGETVALVGSSGCGKSTCIQLLQRFYDPYEGEVHLDGSDLKDLDLTWLRSNIGVVGQEPVLFGTTIAENIKHGSQTATDEDIERAAKKANAHRFIKSLPEGYNTLVGERGAQLSGGQKQRIAIARALVREPAILLLDEATSALDTNSESKVQAALDNASKECTTIIVAHRLSTIRGANRIVVIKAGVAVEEGSHDELMLLKSEYFKLVTTQVNAADEETMGGKRLSITNDEDDNTEGLKIESSKESYEEDEDDSVPFMKIMSLNRYEWPQISIGVFASIVMGCAMPIFAVLFGNMLGVFGKDDPDEIRDQTNKYAVFFVICGVVTGLATFMQIYLFGVAGENLVMRVRGDMFEAMLRQEIGWFDLKENGVGALCSKLSTDAAMVQGATGQRIGTIFQSLATLTLAIGLAMYYEWRLGLVALCFTPIIMGAMFLQARWFRQENTKFKDSLGLSTKLAVEAVSNIRTVVALGCEENFHANYVQLLVPYTFQAKKNTHFRAFIMGLARSIMFFAFAATMSYGGYLMRTEDMHYEDVLKVSQALIMGTVSIANALAFAPNFQKGISAASSAFKLFERVPDIRDKPNAIDAIWKGGNIHYSNLVFSYPTRPNTLVLRGLDLDVLHGKTVALVGPSGCGKSTIVQLLERYYDPNEGSVSTDEGDLREIRLASLRSHLGIVSQEPNLFDRTIAENIAYGDNLRIVDMDEIISAARKANIHTFIESLPLGYDTPLGDKGTQLSGGQKQRVAIARALVRNPKVLLLDEATSALDTESEKVVQEALDNAKAGRTCITIAHRLTTIQDADVICVINEGIVHEMGTHSELLEKRGIYHKLYTLQSGNK